MGSDHAHNLARGVRGARLAAIADADVPRAEALAASLGGPRVFGDGEEMISSGAVDAVIIAAPDPFHAPLALACLEAGLPVLREKPLVPTAAEVVRAHDALPAPLMTVGFMRRFDPGYLALRDRLASGTDGALLMTHSVHRNVEAYPGQDSSATVTNSAVHELDILPWLSGHDVVEVQWTAGRASSLISERHDPQFLLLRDAAGVLHTVELQVHACTAMTCAASSSASAPPSSCRPSPRSWRPMRSSSPPSSRGARPTLPTGARASPPPIVPSSPPGSGPVWSTACPRAAPPPATPCAPPCSPSP